MASRWDDTEKESLFAESIGQFESDREIATADEARAILKLKGMDKVNF